MLKIQGWAGWKEIERGKEEKADPRNILTCQRLSSSVFLDFRIVLYPLKDLLPVTLHG